MHVFSCTSKHVFLVFGAVCCVILFSLSFFLTHTHAVIKVAVWILWGYNTLSPYPAQMSFMSSLSFIWGIAAGALLAPYCSLSVVCSFSCISSLLSLVIEMHVLFSRRTEERTFFLSLTGSVCGKRGTTSERRDVLNPAWVMIFRYCVK